jgi:hypothetical protein
VVRRVLALTFLGLALIVCVALAASESLANRTGRTATAVTVTFSEEVRITSYDESVFPTKEPSSRSETFRFSGGQLENGARFGISWTPSGAEITSTQWETAEVAAIASKTLSESMNARPEFDAAIGASFARSSSDGVGGDRRIPNLGIQSEDLRLRYTTFLELLRRNTGNEPEAVSDPQAIIGPADTLHHGWGSEVTVYVGSEQNGTHTWVDRVIGEVNVGLGRTYLRKAQSPAAQWVFDYTGVDYRNAHEIRADVRLSADGNPLSCGFMIRGLYGFEEDFRTQLRKVIVQTLLLYTDCDTGLLTHLGYDDAYFEKTGFSIEFLNIVTVLAELPNGRDFAPDQNGVNRSPVAVVPKQMRALVGEPLTLDASGSMDPDGQLAEYAWTQQFPTKPGMDYVSDQVAALEKADSPTVSFVAPWPGNYRLALRVTDTMGACGYTTVDIEVRSTGSAFGSVRGVALGAYYDPLYQNRDELVAWLVSHKVGAVTVSPLGFMKTVSATEIEILASDKSDLPNGITISDTDLRALVQSVRAAGIAVMLKPMVEIYAWAAGRWDIAPASWTKWFESYDKFVLHYARIAAELGVEYFCVGTELAPTEHRTSEWRELIRSVRAACPDAAITYEADTVYKDDYYRRVQFWDACDFIGVSGYFRGSGDGVTWGRGEQDPTSAEIEAEIEAVYARTVARVAADTGKPVLLIEAGCASWDGSNQAPWIYLSAMPQGAGDGLGLDLAERIDYYEALGRFVSRTPEIRGVFFWERTFMDPYGYQKYFVANSLEVREPPISDFIRIWYDVATK